MNKILYTFFILLLCTYHSFAQQVSGRIINQNKQPLSGASIRIGAANKTATNNPDGSFNISGASTGDSIRVHVLGYLPYRSVLSLPLSNPLVIVLEEEVNQLQEVEVSTGYQRLPKERATGSFVQVDEQLLNRAAGANVLDRLRDVVPGLIFNTGPLNKKAETAISIRGQSTLSAAVDPLFVLNNFPYEGNLADINPNDVESITILKDAAAASIWGARAANGVIVITTKTGTKGQPPVLSVNSNIIIKEKPDLFRTPVMSIADHIDNEIRLFNNGFYRTTETSVAKTALSPVVELLIAQRDNQVSPTDFTAAMAAYQKADLRRDVSKYLYRNGLSQQLAASLRGAGEIYRYYLSAGHDHDLATSVGDASSRLTVNFNHTLSLLKDRLDLNTQLYYAGRKETANEVSLSSVRMSTAFELAPYSSLTDASGNPLAITRDYRSAFAGNPGTGLLDWTYKPLRELEAANNQNNNTAYQLNLGLNYKILSGLHLRTMYQYSEDRLEGRNLQSLDNYYTRDLINQVTVVNPDGSVIRPVPLGGIADYNGSRRTGHFLRAQLEYNLLQSNNHQLSAIAGWELKQSSSFSSAYRLYGYDDEHALSKIVDYTIAYPKYINPASTMTIPNFDKEKQLSDRFRSFYANAGYTFRGLYSASLSARLDQSNIFGVNINQKGVPLWSAGIAWKISAEDFYKIAWLPSLKLRATYGYNGNIDRTLSAYTTASYNNGNSSQTRLPFASIVNPPNPELAWERVSVLNFGLDFATKQNRVSGSAEYFIKQGMDLIGETPMAPSSGISTFNGNTANTISKGVDLALNARILEKGLLWESSGILSLIRERVSKYQVTSTASNYLLTATGGNTPFEGRPLYAVYSYRWAGLDPETGDPMGYLGEEPSKDYAKIISTATPESIIYHGPSRPPVSGAWRNTLTYKNFSASCNISFRLGHYFRRPSINYGGVLAGNSGHGDYARRWQKPGDELLTSVPSMPAAVNVNRQNLYTYSELLVSKADNIRLQDIRLSYDLGKTIAASLSIKRAQLYLYAANMGVLWQQDKDNIDPEYGYNLSAKSLAIGLKVDL